MNQIENYPQKRVVLLRMSGSVTSDDLSAMMVGMGGICTTYRGRKFGMIADMRDLIPLAPEAAEIMRQGIELSRRSGVVVCAHISSSGIIRLQTNRVSREASRGDAAIFDVVSLDEAWRLTGEALSEVA